MSLGYLVEGIADRELGRILAIRKTRALEASADERDTRGFISMITMRPSAGFTASWMFDPPFDADLSDNCEPAASRMTWYSLSDRVCAGATVIESPCVFPSGPRSRSSR